MLRSPEVEAYLKADRQWNRIHRIRHAKFMLRTTGAEFWNAVLSANGVVQTSGRGNKILPSTSFTLERSLRDEKTA